MKMTGNWFLVTLLVCGFGYILLGGQSACVTCTDDDSDGYAVEGGRCGDVDCDDTNAAVHPDADEICDDGIDNDCDGLIDDADPDCCEDADGDEYEDEACGGADCDDTNPDINPGVDEIGAGLCDDGIDQDCDGNDCTEICNDVDDDGYGDPASPACGHSEADCDDGDADVNPGVAEDEAAGNCDDGIDNDCDGLTDLGEPGCSTGGIFDGNILYGSFNGTSTYLRNNDWILQNSWSSSSTPASIPYLMPDCTLVRPSVASNQSMHGAAAGGRIQKIDWDGGVMWDFRWSDTNHQQHHDIQPMPNGNVLLIAWERKTWAEANAAGRQYLTGEMWPTEIVEVEPSGISGGIVVWEWHLWDHLVQDVDPSKPNYGVVADHPELMDINYGQVMLGDWMHANSIDYNAELDQIVFASRTTSEFYIVDHSTTTQEAAGHTGGNCRKGGDFLYRWGNPQVYDRGDSSDREIYVIHGVNWIPNGYPGAGHILYYNNGVGRPGGNSSSADEIVTPLEPGGCYTIEAEDPFGPAAPVWSYQDNFFTQVQGGAFRLPNGNTLVTAMDSGYVFEVTLDGDVVWSHSGISFARATKYGDDYFTQECGAESID